MDTGEDWDDDDTQSDNDDDDGNAAPVAEHESEKSADVSTTPMEASSQTASERTVVASVPAAASLARASSPRVDRNALSAAGHCRSTPNGKRQAVVSSEERDPADPWSKGSSSTNSSGGSKVAARTRFGGRSSSTPIPMQVERAGPSPADVSRSQVFARLVSKLAARWSDMHPSCARPITRKVRILGVEQLVKVRGDSSCWVASALPVDLSASLDAAVRAPESQQDERIRMLFDGER